MRRLIALLAAVSLVAGPLATAGGAVAKERREARAGQRVEQVQRGGEQRGEQRGGDSGGRWAGARGQPQVYRADPRNEGRYAPAEPRGEARGDYRGDYGGEPRIDPRYEPRVSGAAPRRGGYLGPGAGAVIQNPASQRLRPAPRGYEWVRTARGNALVSQSTGQVFDVVPY